jgi:hypothetical protein
MSSNIVHVVDSILNVKLLTTIRTFSLPAIARPNIVQTFPTIMGLEANSIIYTGQSLEYE